MSSFIVPVVDLGSPRYQTYPDNIRGDTVEGFLLRDRFVYATSRRLIWSVPYYFRQPTAAVIPFQGRATASFEVTGFVWIVARGVNGTIAVSYGTTVSTHLFGSTASTWAAKVTAPSAFPNTTNTIFLTVTRTPGSPSPFQLYGLSVFEEVLSSADLP